MELILWFEKHRLSAILTSSITIKDIILNVKNSLNRQNGNLSIYTKEFEVLPDSFIVEPNDKQKEFFILPKAELPKIIEPKLNSEKIEELIMKSTNANTKLEFKQPEKTKSAYDLLTENLTLKERNLDQLLNILQALDERTWTSSNNNDSHAQTIEPNENSVQELKDMGFPENRARVALVRARNDMNRATDILLNGEDE